jgi:hypothetical protein
MRIVSQFILTDVGSILGRLKNQGHKRLDVEVCEYLFTVLALVVWFVLILAALYYIASEDREHIRSKNSNELLENIQMMIR